MLNKQKIEELRESLKYRSDTELESILSQRDTSEWTPEAIEAMRLILEQRKSEPDIDTADEDVEPRATGRETCPICGGHAVYRTQSTQSFTVSGDRLCKSCDSLWTPPVPKWAAWLMVVIGVFLIASAWLLYCVARLQGGGGFTRGNLLQAVVLIAGTTILTNGIKGALKVISGRAGELTLAVVRGQPFGTARKRRAASTCEQPAGKSSDGHAFGYRRMS